MSPVLNKRVWQVALASIGLVGLVWPVLAGPGDAVFYMTAHGDPGRGVDGNPAYPVGHCRQCHESRSIPGAQHIYGLFADPDNLLCYDCHAGTGAAIEYLGQPTYDTSAHWLSGDLLWPGPNPPARSAGDQGLCLNCHSPHGSRDAVGLIPSQAVQREEGLCLPCHDANGPAATDVDAQLVATDAHPVLAVADVHDVAEGVNPAEPASFGNGFRHAECPDCHNPHAATAADRLAGTLRIAVTNGAAGTVPTYTVRYADDPAAVSEYEVCFKCHSSWTSQPAGSHDLALELNPANASFHPIEGAGTNATARMTNNLNGGTGAPNLTTASVITCSDCHGSNAIGTGVTTVSSYGGATPTGPHGSSAASNANLSGAILRAGYRTTLRNGNYAASEFALCYVCHSEDPFQNGDSADTNFRRHRMHVIGERSTCAECHASIHSTAGAPWATNRGYTRLVAFGSNVTGSNGNAEPIWNAGNRTCTLRCHGKDHDREDY